MSIFTRSMVVSVFALVAIHSVNAQQFNGSLGDKKISALLYLSKTKSGPIVHERINKGDPHEEPQYVCQSKFILPMGTAIINFGNDKIPATLNAIAHLESKDDGACTSPKISDDQTLFFNLLIDLDHDKPAVSYTDDHTGKIINVYNNNTMYDQASIRVSLDRNNEEFNVISVSSNPDSGIEVIKRARGGVSNQVAIKKMVLSAASYSQKPGDSRYTIEDSLNVVLNRAPPIRK